MPAAQRLSALIYLNVLELAQIGGTDYRGQLGPGGTLENDSKCYKNLSLDNEAWTPGFPWLVIAAQNVGNAGAAVPTQTAIVEAIKCNVNFPSADKMAQLLNLQCKLGVHKAYPQ